MKREDVVNESLKGKRILFFGLETMGYERKILHKLKEKGAIVDYYSERPVSNTMGKIIIKFFPKMLRKKTEKYYSQIIKAQEKQVYDIVFIMKCDTPTRKVLKDLKNAFPDAELRLHMWDSMNNISGIEEKLDLFDRITSFDREDCSKHLEFGFRPLFFADEFEVKNSKSIKYDISFCGTIHSDRYMILENVREQCEANGMKFYGYYYLQSWVVYFFLKFTQKGYRHIKKQQFKFKSIGSDAVNEIFQSSIAIVDIQHPQQTGLTMRSIETIGADKKLITTNADIVNYDFYNPNNICVIDRDNPQIPEEFFISQYEEIPAQVKDNYTLDRWVVDVLTM